MGWWPDPEKVQRGPLGRFGHMQSLVLLREGPTLCRAGRRSPLGAAGHSSAKWRKREIRLKEESKENLIRIRSHSPVHHATIAPDLVQTLTHHLHRTKKHARDEMRYAASHMRRVVYEPPISVSNSC